MTRWKLKQRDRKSIGQLALLLYSMLPAIGAAQESWQAEPVFYFNGVQCFSKLGQRSRNTFALMSMAELEFSKPGSALNATLFVDYQVSTDSNAGNSADFGATLQTRYRNWDLTGYLFVNRHRTHIGHWYGAARLRYRIAREHKIGVEMLESLERPGTPHIAGGYYGTLSDRLSLKTLVGTPIGSGPELAAKLELSWTVK